MKPKKIKYAHNQLTLFPRDGDNWAIPGEGNTPIWAVWNPEKGVWEGTPPIPDYAKAPPYVRATSSLGPQREVQGCCDFGDYQVAQAAPPEGRVFRFAGPFQRVDHHVVRRDVCYEHYRQVIAGYEVEYGPYDDGTGYDPITRTYQCEVVSCQNRLGEYEYTMYPHPGSYRICGECRIEYLADAELRVQRHGTTEQVFIQNTDTPYIGQGNV